jgi:hypothetical protein
LHRGAQFKHPERTTFLIGTDVSLTAAAGRSEALRPILAAMVGQGASLRAMAGALAAAGTRTASGQPLSPTQVRRHLMRLGLAC